MTDSIQNKFYFDGLFASFDDAQEIRSSNKKIESPNHNQHKEKL